MTEIIDGVDVSGCKHYWNTHSLELCKINFDNNYYSNGLPLAEKCNDHKDCYYRQLKRLEAQNTKLKNKYNENITVNTQLQEWQDEDLRQIAQLKKDLDLFRKAHDNEQAQRRIFEQKLEKIKKIVTKYSQREDYLLGGLYADLVDGLNEVLKDE